MADKNAHVKAAKQKLKELRGALWQSQVDLNALIDELSCFRDASREKEADAIWPKNVTTVTGHHLWPLLAQNKEGKSLLSKVARKCLQMCLVNIENEGVKDYNFQGWRQLWQDMRDFPLFLVSCVASQTFLKNVRPNSLINDKHENGFDEKVQITQNAQVILSSIIIGSVVKDRYAKYYDNDPRVICFGIRGAFQSKTVFKMENFWDNTGTTFIRERKLGCLFPVPSIKALSAEQDKVYFSIFKLQLFF